MSGPTALLLELVHSSLPEVPLDKGVVQANTGLFLLDCLPLLTMAPCAQTLQLHWRRRRYVDLFLFLTGFLLAVIYHWLHMHPEGIANAQLLGLSGATWRGLDILMAQGLLARTCGHALGARTRTTQLLSTLVFPVSLFMYAHLLADGVLTLGAASRALVLVVLATLAAKGLLEGFDSVPSYCSRRGKRTLACFALGFAAFPMPELFPRHYWLFHSIWHLLMAEGFQQLYTQLEGLHLPQNQQQQRHGGLPDAGNPSCAAASSAVPSIGSDCGEDSYCASSACSGFEEEQSVGSESDASEDSGASGGSMGSGDSSSLLASPSSARARAASRAGGVVYALLQPAARLIRYQRQQRHLERDRRRAAALKAL